MHRKQFLSQIWWFINRESFWGKKIHAANWLSIFMFSNFSMKLWASPCRATQDEQVMVESSDKMWSTGEWNGKPLQYSCLENPMKSMKRQKDRTLKDELTRSVGAQYATGDQWRNKSRKDERMEPKQKQHPAVDVTGERSKVWCVKSNIT